ncbi:DEAD/DEAH box helicase [Dermatobacter hominis]|uniref:DEAD/DEAH box helicase n=1 Tax=Dermatobacter hominis TaxID=2884263 RepID=UPI001D12B764|nr:DEAD/DEAH box helicase [Dermatobacter hominis]UDY34735.1 DEAD/DEAH box helicase [Dermatobacter hominis]
MSAPSAVRPTRIRLRPWQSEALERFADTRGPDFLAVATPGAGKTTFALTAAVQDLADHPGRRLIVVAPTQHLKHQWSRAALRFGLHLDPDWSSRDGALPGDMHGIVTTYQQVATSSRALAGLSRDSFVVFDEIHHAGDDRAWGTSVLEAFEGAAKRLSLSGTPFRSDTSAIPFVEYHLDEARADYEYGYGEALADRGVVRPVYFPRINGFMEWVAPDGEVLSATFDDELTREQANQRLRTALSLEGQWLPVVLDQAHERLLALREHHPEAGGLVIAMDQGHAQEIARVLRERHGVRAVVATSDDPDASSHIAAFAASTDPWIVAVRMVSEGVDLPRLRIAVFATTTTTELFFRQAVGRVVRWTPGLHGPGARTQPAWFFLPDDPRLRRYSAELSESRRHSLRKRRGNDEDAPSVEPDDVAELLGDDEQMSLFSVIGAVALDGAGEAPAGAGPALGVFDDDPEDPGDRHDPEGVELVLLPPPLPGGGHVAVPADDGAPGPGTGPGADPMASMTQRERKARLRDMNADVAAELVRSTGWGYVQVQNELNRLTGIGKVSEATLEQLEARLDHGRRWLRRAG